MPEAVVAETVTLSESVVDALATLRGVVDEDLITRIHVRDGLLELVALLDETLTVIPANQNDSIRHSGAAAVASTEPIANDNTATRESASGTSRDSAPPENALAPAANPRAAAITMAVHAIRHAPPDQRLQLVIDYLRAGLPTNTAPPVVPSFPVRLLPMVAR